LNKISKSTSKITSQYGDEYYDFFKTTKQFISILLIYLLIFFSVQSKRLFVVAIKTFMVESKRQTSDFIENWLLFLM